MCKFTEKGLPEDGDYLGRGYYISQIESLLNVISNNTSSGCIAIKGRWGVGKTFLLNKLEKSLLSHNSDENKYTVIRYNCWQHDYYDEPLVSLVTALFDHIHNNQLVDIDELKKVRTLFFKALADFAKCQTGLEYREYLNFEEENKKEYDSNYSLKNQVEEVRKLIVEVSQKSTIVLLVDELDRCLPEYAIKVLERLHHIFCDIDGFITIIAVDGNQLENSVKKIYGDKVDYDQYIRKYIDFNIELSVGNFDNQMISSVMNLSDSDISDDIREYLQNVISKSKIDIRNIEKISHKIISINKALNIQLGSSVVLGVEFTIELMRYLGIHHNSDKKRVKPLSIDLSWVSSSNYNVDTKDLLQVLLGGDLFTYINNIKDSIKSSEKIIGAGVPFDSMCINEDDLSIMFWVISQIYGKRSAYYLPGKDRYYNLFLDCQRYCELSKIIQ